MKTQFYRFTELSVVSSENETLENARISVNRGRNRGWLNFYFRLLHAPSSPPLIHDDCFMQFMLAKK